MKTKLFIRTMVVVLVSLLAGTSPSWAWDHEETFTDDGNEQCTFRYSGANMSYSGKSLGASDIRGFRTKVKFDNLNGTYYWEFHLRVCFKTLCDKSNTDRLNSSIKGTMFVITDDDVVHKLCDYTKSAGSDKIVLSNQNLDYGHVFVKDQTRYGWLELKFQPGNMLLKEGFKRVRFNNDRLICSNTRSWGPFEYEKETGTNYAPLPAPAFSWDADGKVRVTALGVPNGIDHPECLLQRYSYNGYRYNINKVNYQQFLKRETLIVDDNTMTKKNDNRIDVSTTYEVPDEYAYTMPLWFYTDGITNVKPISELVSEDWEQQFETVMLDPYTHPTELTTTFDQWNQTINVQWTYYKEYTFANPDNTEDVSSCRTDGKWYLLRREKSKDTYQLLNTYNSTQKRFNYTDDECALDKEYVYRVVFLPDVLVGTYADKPQDIPFTGLIADKSISTVPEVPIRLKQDRADEGGVALYWEHSVQDPDAKFSVQRTSPGGSSWTTIARDIAINVNQPYATYVDENVSSPCEFYSYRVVVQTLGHEFASNVIEGNLPAGSRITAVDATKGSEASNVIVKWRVLQRGTDETWFSIRRRILGSRDDWTEIGTTHGTASEYTFVDDRVMAGSYYEYAVIAYSKECDDQPTQSDMLTSSGFSQARGTITGHISFGSGTAVRDVRVNLVKTTEGNEEDMQQYLSRYIEGEGSGLYWAGDSARFANTFNSTRPLTLQFWAQPTNGGSKMELARLNNAIELGLRRADDTAPFTYQYTQLGKVKILEKEDMSPRKSSSGLQTGESGTSLYDRDPNTKMCSKMAADGVYSLMKTHGDVYVTSYILTTANDAAQNPDRNPRSWAIKACKATDNNWVTIATVTDDTRMEAKNSTSYEYPIDVPGNYMYYRFEVYSTQGSDVFQLADLTYKTLVDETLVETINDVNVVSDGQAQQSDDDNPYHLYAIDLSRPGYAVTEFPSLTFSDRDFTHVAALYNDGVWTFQVGTDTLRTGSMVITNTWNALAAPSAVSAPLNSPTLSFGGNSRLLGSAYKGYVDDVRLWNRKLSDKDIASNYTRMLGGTESGLQLYWPLDEGLQVKEYAFDVACQEGIYMLNHPTVGINATPNTHVPEMLKLYGLTDGQGDYIIRGIPFQQGGTNYKVIPQLGIHEFNPNTRSMFISPTSLTANNIDFEDVSDFPMAGHIYYAGTNVPVEGVMFYVDGELLSGNGEAKMTDKDGKYEISVPIGEHYVEARLEGHKMVAGGRFPTKGTFNFDRRVQYDFADSTLVNFVGRISGGQHNDTLAVGFGASKNNIGVATIQLKLNNESFSFNCKDDHITDATTDRTWESDTTSIASRAWTGRGDDAKYIYIHTDSLTGEFSAKLPPLKYITKRIHIKDNPDIEFASLPEVNLTFVQNERTDSIIDDNGDVKYYRYHEKMIRTHFAEPQIDVRQLNSTGRAFGELEIKEYPLGADETVDITDIWTQQANGDVEYTYRYPIFMGGNSYRFKLRGYEVYVNRDNGKVVADTIPMNGQKLTIGNEMSDNQAVVNRIDKGVETDLQVGDINQLKSDEVMLDSAGYAAISWKAGFPNIISPYTRQFHVNFERSDRHYAMTPVEGIILGSLPMGNNFVTKGPSVPLMILHDPPGAKSKTTWKKGTTKTKTRTRSTCWLDNTKVAFENVYGTSITAASGVGFALVSVHDMKWMNHEIISYNHNLGRSHEQTWALTTTESISTGTDIVHVGSSGDVFIGVSKNILLGDCRKVGFFRNGDRFMIDMRDSKCLSDSINTTFMYSAHEIETVMIPKWEELRDSMFVHKATKEECETYQPGDNENVYLTWENKNDENYGLEGHYVWKTGKNVTAENDVHWYNQQISAWRQLLENNEKDKVLAIEDNGNRYWQRNISFDGGTNFSYSERRDTTNVWKDYYSGSATFTFDFSTNIRISTGATMATDLTFSTENGVKWDNSGSDFDENIKSFAEFDYDFVDGNFDTQFSVDIYKSPAGFSDIFRLFGGQSYNPYEGEEKTKYYEKGKHTLSNGTVQMEQPYLAISTNGQNPTKNLTVTDIPSGQELNLTLHCSNMANVHQGLDFSYDLVIVEKTNTNGLQILMDGVPINGRSIRIPQSETVTKQITIRQTDESILDYEGIRLRFCSQYQGPVLYDEVTLNAHFTPSSSPIDLVIGEPVLNIETLNQNEGNVVMKLTNFDRMFKNLKFVGVEYRYEGNTQWNTIHTFVTNKADSLGPSYSPLPETGTIRYTYNMKDDNLFPQGTYTFRAFTNTPYGQSPNDAAVVYSREVTVVKDNLRPRNLTTPEPANGILRYGDDICIEFNEDIVPGYVSDKNVIVTAKLNNQPVNHDVALQLIPYGVSAHTINPVFLNGDFSIEFWVKWTQGGYLLRWGKSLSLMSMSIDNEGHVKVSIGGSSFLSKDILPKDTWTYIAVSYKASDMTFSALGEYGTESVLLFDHQPVTFSALESISYSGDNLFYLGSGITAAIHDLALYNIYRDVNEAGATKYVSKDQYVYGLTNYWPMNEGHGSVAADSRHTHDFEVTDRWELSNVNHSFDTSEKGGLTADISRINTSAGDSYAIELWTFSYNGAATLFETGSNASNKLCLRYDDDMNLLLDYGEKSQVVANHNDFPLHDSWHHVALNVVRGQAASFYYNGQRTAVIAEVDMPPLEGSQIKIGTDNNGRFDELRIWHASLTEDRLLANMYNCIDTTDIYSRGLVAYYPFEKRETVNGVQTYVGTLEDMAPANTIPGHAATADPSALKPFGPPLKKAPEESRLIAKPVASERKIVIRLEEGAGIKARDVEGTTLNITVDKVYDVHGNQSNPIRWTAYVQANTLKWTKDSVNVIKKYGDDYTFDVNIENRSGSTEYYTLYNMPQWLTLVDSERTDDVSPLSTKTLRFQVNSLVAVGNYDVTIGLQGNNEILEPLRIVMKVRGQQPAWSVDPNAYENTMSIVGQIYVNGILMGNSESLLAAFIGDECRGVVKPKLVRDAAYVAMSVYGTAQQSVNGVATDLDKGRPVTFRIWDATTGMTYTNVNISLSDSVMTDAIDFDPTMSYGTFDHPIIFSKSNLVEQQLNIKSGWNWLSLGVEPAAKKTSVVFKDLVTWNAQLKDQGTGVAYSRGNYWAGNLKEVHANTMYKLQLTRLETSNDLPKPFTVNGEQVKLAETPVKISKGWSWIAYTPLTTIPIGEALAGANPRRGDQVKSQTGFSYYGPYGWEGNLEALESGKGYLYHSTDTVEKQFVYPTLAASRRLTAASRPASAVKRQSPSAFSPVEPTDYPDNMAIVIKLTDSGEPIADAELAAFVDGECRGTAFADEVEDELQSPLYYLLVAGEGSGQPMEIRASINGTVMTVCNTLTYTSDGSIGTPWEPFVIDIKDPSGINDIHWTMDDGVWYTPQGIRYGTVKPKVAGVYLYNGQKVVIK